MSHLFVVTLREHNTWAAVDRVGKILEEYDKLYIGAENTTGIWKFRWVVENFPEIDNEFKTFLKLQIGYEFEILDWNWNKRNC